MNTTLVSELNRLQNWSIIKNGGAYHVMADNQTCFICHDFQTAAETAVKASNARNEGSSQAVRSLAEKFRLGKTDTESNELYATT